MLDVESRVGQRFDDHWTRFGRRASNVSTSKRPTEMHHESRTEDRSCETHPVLITGLLSWLVQEGLADGIARRRGDGEHHAGSAGARSRGR